MAEPARRKMMDARAAIVANITRELRSQLRPRYRTLVQATIVNPIGDGTRWSAELAVDLVPLRPGLAAEPLFVVDLFPSATIAGFYTNVDAYRSIASVEEILCVQLEKRRADLWRRAADEWLVRNLLGDAIFRLHSVGAEMTLSAIYENTGL